MRILCALFVTASLIGCSAANIASPIDVVSSYNELAYIDVKLDKRKRFYVSGELSMVQTEHGDAFVLPLNVPPNAKSLYFQSGLYVTDRKTLTWNVSYPTFVFFDAEMNETKRIEPELTAVWKESSRYSMYFEHTIDLLKVPNRIAAVFSPEHFGYKLNYNARVPHTVFVAGTVQRTSEKTDRAVPIGPHGVIYIEIKTE